MTTNHIKNLDAALIRPGRADIKVEFRLADRAIIAWLFNVVYKHLGNVPEKGAQAEANGIVQEEAKADREAKRIAEDIAVEKLGGGSLPKHQTRN